MLLLCFVAPVATTFLILKIQKKQIRKEVKWKMIAGIDKKELVLLKFTENEKQSRLRWKHSKEFEFEGQMYDITDSKVAGDTTYYWCWWDYEETKLNKKLNDVVQLALGNNPDRQENHKRIQKFFKSLYFSELDNRKASIYNVAVHLYSERPDFYKSMTSSPLIPPPKIA